jgi:hypothetical protein
MVVAGRGKPEDMEAFDEMQLLHSKSSDFERYLSRSFLLEHGVHATNIVKELNNNSANDKK